MIDYLAIQPDAGELPLLRRDLIPERWGLDGRGNRDVDLRVRRGEQGRAVRFHISGVTEDGIFAGRGSDYVTITVVPSATTAQIKAFANQLL